MECKLIVKVFRFNSKTDYLPYYKKHVVKIDTQKSVSDLLLLIQDEESSFEYPQDKYAAIKINDKSLFTTEKLEDIVEFFGKELQLDPLSSKRAVQDLTINIDDFLNRFDILDALVDSKDKKVFNSYIKEHYSSPVLQIEEEFLGDALFAFAYDMIKKYPERKKSILKAISSHKEGIFLHVNISNKLYPVCTDLERKIDYLKNEIVKLDVPTNCYVEKQQKLSRSL